MLKDTTLRGQTDQQWYNGRSGGVFTMVDRRDNEVPDTTSTDRCLGRDTDGQEDSWDQPSPVGGESPHLRGQWSFLDYQTTYSSGTP